MYQQTSMLWSACVADELAALARAAVRSLKGQLRQRAGVCDTVPCSGCPLRMPATGSVKGFLQGLQAKRRLRMRRVQPLAPMGELWG